jgi:hypothetical protein
MELCHWKGNWSETREHLLGWWEHRDFVIGKWGGTARQKPRMLPLSASPSLKDEAYFLGGARRAEEDLQTMAAQDFPGDIVPVFDPFRPWSIPMALAVWPVDRSTSGAPAAAPNSSVMLR